MLTVVAFFFNDPAPTEIYTLSLHDALPISGAAVDYALSEPVRFGSYEGWAREIYGCGAPLRVAAPRPESDRKSTRLNSSHMSISYAVFCLKKKKTTLMAWATGMNNVDYSRR